MTTAEDLLLRGREAFARRAWTNACAGFAAADRERPLGADDLERLATAAWLIGSGDESAEVWARAHHDHLGRGDVRRAARCAFWLASGLFNRGERARSAAWIARADKLVDTARAECVEQGYLLLPAGLECLFSRNLQGAHAAFRRAADIADRFQDPDLTALARHNLGRVLIRMGRHAEGVGLLDEAMVAIDAGDVSPLAAGEVYCSVIEGCIEIFDLRRAREWTTALTRWCGSQPDLRPFSGQCQLRRAEILQVHGAWPEAADAVREACERLTQPAVQPASGAAYYQRGEIHRLRGEVAQAEDAYRLASRHGRKPQPGLALLRLAQGQVGAAAGAIRLALEEAGITGTRARLLPAAVEIMLAAHDVPAARAAAEELAGIAAVLDAPLLHALAGLADGAVRLAVGDARAGLTALRRAWTTSQEIEAPYEAARARVLIAQACAALGDTDAATMELDAARWIFEQLGARPDLARVDACAAAPTRTVPGGLSPREIQVLRLVAAGMTNRAIAADLFISERTVERHVSNIFVKLDVSSRAAATAYAYEHSLV